MASRKEKRKNIFGDWATCGIQTLRKQRFLGYKTLESQNFLNVISTKGRDTLYPIARSGRTVAGDIRFRSSLYGV